MFEFVGTVRSAVTAGVAAADAHLLSGPDALRVLKDVEATMSSLSALKAALVSRVADANVAKGHGNPSTADLLSRELGVSPGDALRAVKTAEQLERAPQIAERLARGELSLSQADELAPAVAKHPDQADRLLEAVDRGDSFAEVKRQAREVRLAGDDLAVKNRRVHANRFLKTWTDPDDGAGCGQWKTTADQHAAIVAALAPFIHAQYEDRRVSGEREPEHAYAVDALAALAATGGASRPGGAPRHKTEVVLDISQIALDRGTAEPGETCAIRGVGPVPVSVAREVIGDCFLKIVVRDGVDITHVTHVGHTLTEAQRTAVTARSHGTCEITGCGRAGQEFHHIWDYKDRRFTNVADIAHICGHDHDQITHRGATLTAAPHGGWVLHKRSVLGPYLTDPPPGRGPAPPRALGDGKTDAPRRAQAPGTAAPEPLDLFSQSP